MKFRVKVISKNHYEIQWRYWWSFWRDEGTTFTSLGHALRYVADLKREQRGGS